MPKIGASIIKRRISDPMAVLTLGRIGTSMDSPVRCSDVAADIPGFPGYRATASGYIQSFRFGEWSTLKPWPNKFGYLRVRIAGRNRRVHSLVMLAFVGPRPKGKEVLHRNDIPNDNRLSNLRYGTKKENAADKRANRARAENQNQVSL